MFLRSYSSVSLICLRHKCFHSTEVKGTFVPSLNLGTHLLHPS
uniref:Uncharacterized protein n=1 Tax=Anguilla anguilla TaxID=7936 RepID=A0A0E9VH84_ANGAN